VRSHVKNLSCNVLLEVSMHVWAIGCALEFDVSGGSVGTLGESKPHIFLVLAACAGERAVLVVEAVVSEVVMAQAVGLCN